MYLVDKFFIRGVHAERAMNESNLDYRQSRDHEQKGIRDIIHKFFLGMTPYYITKHLFDNLHEL